MESNNDMALVLTVLIITFFVCIILVYCFALDLVTWFVTWVYSTTEEKIGLTRSKGHYNANGYLVHSDSDIHLDSTGSFKRFDSVDKDFRITLTTTSLMGDLASADADGSGIPPQPLRPAPVPMTTPASVKDAPPSPTVQRQFVSKEELPEKTSISPIPRPVSSVNMATLASQSGFPCITPPPSPMTPAHHPPAQKFGGFPQPSTEATPAEDGEVASTALKRALSCDSVCSDTSVALGDLEEPNVTGFLCIGLEYDSECGELIANVLEAKDLIGPATEENPSDTYVRVILLPEGTISAQTKVNRGSNSPSYKERFVFPLNPREQSQHSLAFQVFATDRMSHTLLGEGDIRLCDVSLRQPVTTWVTLTDTGQRGTEFGELMFSLSYLPTAERLTAVVVKARNLKFQNDKTVGDSFVKVYLMQHGKKINKKKTSTKKDERSPIFNEAMIFSVPAHTLPTIQLRLTVAEVPTGESPKAFPIGHVIVGSQASGRSFNHWNQMLTALRKPVAMWHPLRK